MNILVLVASRRSPGNSELLAMEAKEGAQEAGANAEMINISRLKIESCGGCLRCVFKGSCSGEDDMEMLLKKIIKADGLIVAAPVYLLSPASVIKKTMDRALMASLYIDELAERRRGALTITVAGKSDWNPLGTDMLNQFALSYGFPIFNYIEGYAPGPAEILLQEDLVAQTRQNGRDLVKHLKGEIKAREVEENQCPSCYSRTFRFVGDNKVQCAICLAKGTLDENNKVVIPQSEVENAFWTPAHRKRHLEEWIKATRGMYLEKRPKIKELLRKYGY